LEKEVIRGSIFSLAALAGHPIRYRHWLFVRQTIQPPLQARRSAMKEKLTFSDGLNFGCGFFTAGFIFSIVIIPVAMLLFAILTAVLGAGAAGMLGG
jgi:hypothetical protein